MAELVADCSRCSSKRTTFDIRAATVIGTKHGWQNWYEAFCVCRHCARSTVFILSEIGVEESRSIRQQGLPKFPGSANRVVRIESFVSLKDEAGTAPPDHLPEDIQAAFAEGATCLAVHCPNAAATMFRLCVDLATRSMVPAEDGDGLNARIRRDLGLRLPWLFDHGRLPEGLRDLSACIREDGNDGAHAGTLKMEDAEDLLDFANALLERIYTEPERLRLAKERRETRRTPAA